jgi:hypothetical protein
MARPNWVEELRGANDTRSPSAPSNTDSGDPEEPTAACRLIVRSGPTPAGPIRLNAWTTIINPEKFIRHTLDELSAYVGGRASWVRDLVDEKIDALRACGVEVEILELQ